MMTLSLDLRKAGIEWCIDLVCLDEPSVRYPGKVNQIQRLRTRLVDMAAVAASGKEPVTMESLMHPDNSTLDVEHALSLAMRRNMPKHPVYRAWLESKGNTPVTIRADLLGESLGECIHTALRKNVEGPQSCIQWQAIHRLAPADWSQLLEMAREEIRKRMQDVERGKLRALTYHSVGWALKTAFVERADEVSYREDPKTHRRVERTETEAFALMALEMACKLTDAQDFIWGWTAYLCEDAPAPAAAAELAQELVAN